jgi:hypothetical protein
MERTATELNMPRFNEAVLVAILRFAMGAISLCLSIQQWQA